MNVSGAEHSGRKLYRTGVPGHQPLHAPHGNCYKGAVEKRFPMLKITNISMHHIASVAKVQYKMGFKFASAVDVAKRLVEIEPHSPSV